MAAASPSLYTASAFVYTPTSADLKSACGRLKNTAKA